MQYPARLLSCLLALLAFPSFAQTPPAIEDLGPVAYQANVSLGPLAPTPDGAGFVQLLYSFPEGGVGFSSGPFEIVAVNLQTGAVSRTKASSGSASVGWQVWSHLWGRDGKLYLGTNGPPHLISWDYKTGVATDHGRRWPGIANAAVVYSLAVATDGAIIGGGANVSTAFRHDPATGSTTDYPVLGLPRTSFPAYAYSIAGDARFIYAASGKSPWYLVAYDRTTGTQKNLKTYTASDFIEMVQYPSAVYAKVMIAVPGGSPRYEFYRLENGGATQVASLPSRVVTSPLPKSAPPSVFLDSAVEAGSSAVTLWYKPAPSATLQAPGRTRRKSETWSLELGAWSRVSVPVFVQPRIVDKLVTLPDGAILGATRPYGELFRFDPATGKREVLGSHRDLSAYGMRVAGGSVYLSGYPNVPLWRYDPARPYTAYKDTPTTKAPPVTDAASNPRQLLVAGPTTGAHYGRFVVADSKGRIHVGAHAERNRVGGAFVTYEPATGTWAGIGVPKFADYDCEGLATTLDRRFVVYSSRAVGAATEAKLFVYDAEAGSFVREFVPFPGLKTTGLLATGRPGQIVGAARKGAMTLLYAVDVASERVLWSREAPGVPPDGVYAANPFVYGPDHFLYTFLGFNLTRLNPITGETTFIVNVPSAGDLAFSGGDLYIAGTTSLRRIKGLVPVPCPHSQ